MPLRLLPDMDMHYQEESVRDKSDANLHSDSGERFDALLPEKKYPDYCKTLTYTDASGHVKELVLPKALDLDRPKRARTTFSPEQLYQLETEFGRNQYLVGRERSKLAQRLQLSETQVKVWFQNRRTKCKRDQGRDHDSPLPHNNSHTSSQTSMSFLGQQSPARRPDKGLQLTGPLRYPPPPPQATSLGFAPPLSLPGMYGVNISDIPYVPSFAGRPYGALPHRMCAINSPLSAMTSPAGPSAASLDAIVTSRTGAMTTYSQDAASAAKCTQSREMARNSYLMASSVHSKS